MPGGAAGTVRCSSCGNVFPESDIITIAGRAVCATCKPRVVQQMVEGADPGPLVCSCFAVGRNTILSAIEANGFTEASQVVSCLRAGGNCGSCLPEIMGLLGCTPNTIPVSTSTALPPSR